MEKHQTVILAGKSVLFCWLPSHVGIPGNERADAAAKEALFLPVSQLQIPHSDYRTVVKSHFRGVWQTR